MSEELDISKQRVRQIEQQALKKLRHPDRGMHEVHEMFASTYE